MGLAHGQPVGWVEIASSLTAPNSDPSEFNLGDNYGAWVTTDGQYAAAGIPRQLAEDKSIVVFERTGAVWEQVFEQSIQTFNGVLENYQWFEGGMLRGGRLAIALSYGGGNVYLYWPDTSGRWLRRQVLAGQSGDIWPHLSGFGYTLCLSEDARWLVVTATANSDNFGVWSDGGLFFYRWTGSSYSFVHFEPTPSELIGDYYCGFGEWVALMSDELDNLWVAVAAPEANGPGYPGNPDAADEGAVYVYTGSGSSSDVQFGVPTRLDSTMVPSVHSGARFGDGGLAFGRLGESDDDVYLVVPQVNDPQAFIYRDLDAAGWTRVETIDGPVNLLPDSTGDRQPEPFFGVHCTFNHFWLGLHGFDGAHENDGRVHEYELDAQANTVTLRSIILPNDPAARQVFGTSLEFAQGHLMVGNPYWDRPGQSQGDNTGRALFFMDDIDEDGIPSFWEIAGGVDVTGNGAIDITLPEADALKKNLYVEFDRMFSHLGFDQQAADWVKESFARAPVSNPGNGDGIILNIVFDDETPNEIWNGPGWPIEFDSYKFAFFGTEEERFASLANPSILETKKRLFRYCVGPWVIAGGDYGGIAELPGNDAVLNTAGSSSLNSAFVFMHELGHNLGLPHGGIDGMNHKPNYPSIMNYLYCYPTAANLHLGLLALDYSREAMEPLVEYALTEDTGIVSHDNPANSYYANWRAIYWPNELHQQKTAFMNGSWIDWDDDGLVDLSFVDNDVNYAGPPAQGQACRFVTCPTPNQEMNTWSDWDNIMIKMGVGGDFAEGRHEDLPEGEPTHEDLQWLQDNITSPCLADMDADDDADSMDVGVFMHAYSKQQPEADMNLDGQINGIDVGLFLHAYGTGC